VNAEQRTCPACGSEFTWTPAAPRQKFCGSRCKNRWWDRYRRQAVRALAGGSTSLPAGQGKAGDPGGTAGDRSGSGPAALAATPACPHCRQPVALVAWLVPPAAASVTTPMPATPPQPALPQPALPRHATTMRDIP
jgi:endogenous inhibitor of DNA gyrase (YacG/DUF329 family)